jgi:hypothetical protein
MGITLTSKTINSTYDSLLKLSDNDSLTGAFKVITDGLGNDTGVSLNNTGDVTISGTLTVNTRIKTPLLQLTGGTGTQGEMSWNTDEETVDVILNGSTLQLGQEVHVHVRNNYQIEGVGQDIPNGTPVYVTGTLGASGRLTIAPMIANGTISAEYFIGVTTEDIAYDTDGKVTWFGKVRGFDTSGYTEGIPLYVSETVAGGWQTTEPTAPNPKLEVAFTVNQKSNGTIFVRGRNGQYLHDNHDVKITSVADKDLLVYNSTDGIWENSKTLGNITTGTISSGNITTSGYLRGPETFIIDPSAYGNNTGLVQILGDLRVDGTTTTVNSTTVTINDKNIVLADEAETAGDADGAGITINGANATLTYASATDDFTFNKDIVVTRENDNSLITFFRGGDNPTTNELLGQFVFKTDFDGNPQTWARIDIDTNDSAVRTDMDFSVKSTSGNIETALKLQGGSAKPKAFFYNSVTAPTFIGDLTGNASTASKWATARTITLGGDLTGNVSIDGSANVTLTAAVVDDSHTHDGRYYTETEADSKFLLNTTDTLTGDLTVTGEANIKNTIYSEFGSSNTDITGLLSGSTFGTWIKGRSAGHVVIGIRDNDDNDSFAILSGSGNYSEDDTYDKLLARFQANGDITLGGNTSINGTLSATGYNKSNWDTAYSWGDWETGVTKAFVDALNVDASTIDNFDSQDLYRKVYGTTWGSTPTTKYIEFEIPYISSSGGSNYYYIDIIGHRDIGNLNSQLHYRLYVHSRGEGVNNNTTNYDLYKINEPDSEKFEFFKYGGGTTANVFVIKVGEDYSGIEILAIPAENDINASYFSSTTTEPTGLTAVPFSTTKIGGGLVVTDDVNIDNGVLKMNGTIVINNDESFSFNKGGSITGATTSITGGLSVSTGAATFSSVNTFNGSATFNDDITLNHSATGQTVDGITITNVDGDGVDPYTGVLSVESGNKLTWNGYALLTTLSADAYVSSGPSGDTMEGNLTISNTAPLLYLKDSNSTGATDSYGQIKWYDSTNAELAAVGFYGADSKFYIDANGSDIYIPEGKVGIGVDNPEALLHVKAADGIAGVLKIEGGINPVTAIGTINAQLDFGSNDASVNNTGNIGGRIATVTEASNGAHNGMAFYTFQQSRTPDLKEAVRITNAGYVGIGTSTPSTQLELFGSSQQEIKITLDATTDHSLRLQQTGSGTYIGGQDSSGNVNFAFRAYNYSHISNNLGLGITVPVQHQSSTERVLHIANSNVASVNLDSTGGSGRCYVVSSTASGNWQIYDDDANNTRLLLNSSGNLGIGNTNPLSKLDVDSGSSASGFRLLSSSTNYTGMFIGNTSTGSASVYLDASNGDFAGGDYMVLRQNDDLSGEISMSVNAGGFKISMADAPKLTVLQDGKVGIGTETPDRNLEVETPSGSASTIRIRQLSYNYWDLSCPSSNTGFTIGDVGGEKMRITSVGNVGINTDAPSYKLEVNGGGGNAEVGIISGNEDKSILRMHTDTNEGVILESDDGSTTNFYIKDAGSGSARFTLNRSNGRVGVNTTNPEAKMHIVGTNEAFGSWGYATLLLENASNYPAIVFRQSGVGTIVRQDNNGNLQIANGSTTGSFTERFRVDTSGNVLATSGYLRSTNGYTTDGNAKHYVWRLDNTASSSGWMKIARVIAGQSTRVRFELIGHESYGGGQDGGRTIIIAQINNNNDLQGSWYTEGGYGNGIRSVNFEDLGSGDFNVNIEYGPYAEYAIDAIISDGVILTYDTSTTTKTANVSQVYNMRSQTHFHSNVGINTTSPVVPLHIGNGTNQQQWITNQGYAGWYSGLKLARGSGNWSNTANNNFGFTVTDTGLEFCKFTTLNDASRTTIGLFNASGDFHADGDVIAYSTTISDKRLKDEVETIDNALDKVKSMRGVSYVWNNGSRKGQKDLGLIAQEVEEVLPELVREKEMPLIDDSGEKYKTVDYEKMVGVLIEAIKEQQEQIDELKRRLDERS